MSLKLANNVGALVAQNNLNRSSTNLGKSLERLSSGLKVNRGADGPAALVISEKQRSQIAGLRQAIDNTEKAVSVVQTAEGALNEINSLLVKVRGLALDSANSGVNDDDALAANQAEIDNVLDTINRIANNTQFGTKKLLDGSSGTTAVSNDSDVTFLDATAETQTGTYAVNITQEATKAIAEAGFVTTTTTADETLTINGVNITLETGLDQAGVIARINEFSDQTGVIADDQGTTVAGATRLVSAGIGGDESITVQSSLAGAVTTSGFANTATTETGQDVGGTINGVSATGDGDVLTSDIGASKGLSVRIGIDPSDSTQTVSGAQGNVDVTNNALVFQIGANQNQTASISISRVNPTSLGVGVTGNQFATLNEIDITSAAKAQDALAVIDAAVDDITNLRGGLGAFQQNTLSSTANNLRATLENTVNAESIIRDTDFAEEISNFTKQQVLVQAGTSTLSSANQTSQLVLSLLG